jgi:hypothetical protein
VLLDSIEELFSYPAPAAVPYQLFDRELNSGVLVLGSSKWLCRSCACVLISAALAEPSASVHADMLRSVQADADKFVDVRGVCDSDQVRCGARAGVPRPTGARCRTFSTGTGRPAAVDVVLAARSTSAGLCCRIRTTSAIAACTRWTPPT